MSIARFWQFEAIQKKHCQCQNYPNQGYSYGNKWIWAHDRSMQYPVCQGGQYGGHQNKVWLWL